MILPIFSKTLKEDTIPFDKGICGLFIMVRSQRSRTNLEIGVSDAEIWCSFVAVIKTFLQE
jgi:hypothetical protein